MSTLPCCSHWKCHLEPRISWSKYLPALVQHPMDWWCLWWTKTSRLESPRDPVSAIFSHQDTVTDPPKGTVGSASRSRILWALLELVAWKACCSGHLETSHVVPRSDKALPNRSCALRASACRYLTRSGGRSCGCVLVKTFWRGSSLQPSLRCLKQASH